MNKIWFLANTLFLFPSALFGTLYEAYVWKKYFPQLNQMQRIYCFSDVHHGSPIARKQVQALVSANELLKSHGYSMLIINELDDDIALRMSAKPIREYQEKIVPCLQCECPVNFFDYLALWRNKLYLVPIDFRIISAFTSNFFNWFIAGKLGGFSEDEMLQLFGLDALIAFDDNHERYTTFCNLCGLTIQNLFQEYCRIFNEINRYPERNVGPYKNMYDAILHEVAYNAAIIFEPYYRGGCKNESIYTYVMRNTSFDQRKSCFDGYDGDSMLHYLDQTMWCSKLIDARVIHTIVQNPFVRKIVICLGNTHINYINSLLPELGFQNESYFSVIDTNDDSEEDGSDDDEPRDEFYLDPQLIKMLLTRIH